MTAKLVRSEIGTVADAPGTLLLNTTDNFATITTAGYLNKIGEASGAYPRPTDFVFVNYSGGNGIFAISNNNGVFTLEANSGDVITPTIQNHIATYANTSGTISEDPATAISGGNIQAGLSGTAGSLISYPATASKGSLALTAVANTGNTATVVSNAAMGQATTVSIPDPGVASTKFILADNTGTQNISTGSLDVLTGNLTAGSSGHAGTVSSFPGTASKGSLILAAVNNAGNTNTTISNAAMGQASVVSIPDPGAATANFLISASAGTQHITAGSLSVDAGNITAGSSGHAGTLTSFPGTATEGSLIVAATSNAGGNFTTTVTNAASVGQSTVISIPDPGATTANFLLDHGVNTLATGASIVAHKVNGTEASNAVTASGMSGVITTSSLSTAGGGSYAITWTNTFISTTSTVLLSIQGGTNSTQNITMTVAPGSGSATLTIYNNTAATALNGTIFIGYLVI
jgi:hypothetical protein